MLAGRILALCAELLPDGRREGHEWVAPSRWGGGRRALSVHLTGAKAGIWADFSTGGDKGGDALRLVAEIACGGDIRRALSWARAWLGLDAGDPATIERKRLAARADAEQREHRAELEAQEAQAGAVRLWLAAAERIAGTPVDAYLRGRGIDLAQLGRQPRALRAHAGLWHAPSRTTWPGMVAAITDANGRHVASHRTFLQVLPDGRVRKAPVEPCKMVLGSYAGACIRLWRGASGRPLAKALAGETVDITEGIEDGLSVALALPEARVLAAVSLSNMGVIVLPPAIVAVRLWRQNDTAPAAIAAFQRAVAKFLQRGLRVLVPDIPANIKDVNDLLRADVA